jgi:hypothetical protein
MAELEWWAQGAGRPETPLLDHRPVQIGSGDSTGATGGRCGDRPLLAAPDREKKWHRSAPLPGVESRKNWMRGDHFLTEPRREPHHIRRLQGVDPVRLRMRGTDAELGARMLRSEHGC